MFPVTVKFVTVLASVAVINVLKAPAVVTFIDLLTCPKVNIENKIRQNNSAVFFISRY
jgi:hypothetical protein